MSLTEANPVLIANEIASSNELDTQQKYRQLEAAKCTKEVYDTINPSFENVHNVTLAKALTDVKELNIEPKRSKAEKKRERREYYRRAKQATKAQWEKNSVIR